MIPLSPKVEAINATNVPTKVCSVINYAGIVNYYRDVWRKRTHTLAPITKLFPTKVKFKWAGVEIGAFIAMNNIVKRGVLLYYLNFSEIFIIHTEARKRSSGE